MFFLVRPTAATIRSFLARNQDRAYSYGDVGATFAAPPEGYIVDHHCIKLGRGPAVFACARGALQRWAMSRVGWVEVWPQEVPIKVGTTVAVLARSCGVWSLFGCRVVRVVELPGAIEEFGFSYGTLRGHLLAGEERFSVRWDHGDDSVWYDLLAFSRPASFLARLAYPLIRRAQRRFAPDSLRAMAQAVNGVQ